MRVIIAAAVGLMITAGVLGCRPAGRAYSYLQYHNIHLQLAKSTMTINAGSGGGDAGQYMNAAHYAGEYKLGDVRVLYPDGANATAEEVARAFVGTSELVRKNLGIDWSFELELRLVRLPDNVSGLHYAVNLRKSRKLVFPIFLNSKNEVRADWAPIVAHEITESSMIAPQDKHKMVLADPYAGDFGFDTRTRWFRDGVSDRAADMLGEQLYPGRYLTTSANYSSLNYTRESVLDWSNKPDAPNYYSAAAALIYESENNVGKDAIARVMQQLSREHIPAGSGLRRAFERGTGLKLPDYLANYTTPWLGASFTDSKPDPLNPPLTLPGNMAVVKSVYDWTPAQRCKLCEGDIVESFAGVITRSAGQLRSEIARHKPGEMVAMRIRRGDNVQDLHIKLIAAPSYFAQFLQFSRYVPGTLAEPK